ncbi:recombinase family protein [Cryobacterium sinapicolor]
MLELATMNNPIEVIDEAVILPELAAEIPRLYQRVGPLPANQSPHLSHFPVRCRYHRTSGRLMLNMLATLAEYERELITERVNAGIAAARYGGTKSGRPLSDPIVVADKLKLVTEARAKGRTAEDAARLVGWSRANLYRHQQALAARESTTV